MLHYVIREIGCSPHVGKTVLWKLLYFSDFDYYELYECSITNERYCKLERGPAPRDWDQVVESLVKEGKIDTKKKLFHGKVQQKFISLRNPDLDSLSAEELTVINNVIKKYGSMNASQISEFSHRDMPWKATDLNEDIDYELVFYRERLTSVREYQDEFEDERPESHS